MKSQKQNRRTMDVSMMAIMVMLFLISCNGCRSGKVTTSEKLAITTPEDSNMAVTSISPDQNEQKTSSQGTTAPLQKPMVKITREFLGKQITLEADPAHPGGEAWTTIWEEDVKDVRFERKNRICQLSPTVLLYRRFPAEVSNNFFYLDQPEKIEFMDSTYKTIKTVDIWQNRPYQDIKNVKLTYWNFDSEGMGVIPYTEQKTPVTPNEYSLFTGVYSEGHHVMVNYELRSIKNVKNFGMEGYSCDVVAVKHTLLIYDLQGNLKYELKDLPSVDQAVVSNDGKYMMYVFGGMGLATANSPFATIERSGWALMRLEDRKVVYQEYTDDGILAFNRLWMHYGFLKISYSTPSEKIDYDYWIYFDENDETIYTYKLTKKDRDTLREQFKITNRVDVSRQFKDFNFNKIEIKNK